MPDRVLAVPSVSCRALHGHRDAQSGAGAPAPRDPSEVAQAWGRGGTLYPVPAATGKGSEEERKEGREEEESQA